MGAQETEKPSSPELEPQTPFFGVAASVLEISPPKQTTLVLALFFYPA
jgi:hypothetical protein